MERLRGRISLLTWMVGFNTAMNIAMLGILLKAPVVVALGGPASTDRGFESPNAAASGEFGSIGAAAPLLACKTWMGRGPVHPRSG